MNDINLILTLANQHTTMKQVGNVHWGCCPLPGHEEKTASFAIKSNGKFNCYGCNAFGDVIDLYQAIHGTDFETAKRALGLWTDTPGQRRTPKPKPLPTSITTDDKREAYRAARQSVIQCRDFSVIYRGKIYHNIRFIALCLIRSAVRDVEVQRIMTQMIKQNYNKSSGLLFAEIFKSNMVSIWTSRNT